MTREPPPPPGARLRAIARLVFDADTIARVVDPTLADMQHECAEANDPAEARRAAWRGYLAFWKLVALSPFAFNDWPGRQQAARTILLVGALATLTAVAFSAESEWMTRLLARLGLQHRISSVADIASSAWLLGTAVVTFMILVVRRSPFRTAPASVLLVAGASVLAAVSHGAARFIATFAAIAEHGSGGIQSVAGVVQSLALPVLLALGMTALMSLAVGVSQWRAARAGHIDTPPAAGRAGVSPIPIAGAVVVSLAVVNHWLRLNESLIAAALDLLLPSRRTPGMSFRDVAGRTEVAMPLVLLGWVLVVAMVVAALAAWRATSSGVRHPLVQWATRFAVVAMLAGCVWHGQVIGGLWLEFHTESAKLQSQPPRPPSQR
jgi:hypothetical protein